MASWHPVMTDAGRAAIQAADGLGLSARITHVALGTGRYAIRGADGTPTEIALAATALTNERLRVQCYAGGSVEPGSLLIVAQVPQAATEAEAFYISEIGFFDENGTLLVVWSDLTASMGQRGTLAPWNLSLSFAWKDMPSGSITVNVVNAAFSDQLLRTARLQAQVQRAAQEAGVAFYADDPMVLSTTIGAMVNQAFASLNKAVRQPIAVAPADGATGQVLTPQLRGSTFFSADGYTHTKSQFVVVNQAGVVVHDSGEIPPSLEYTLPTGLLAILTTYRWRVRYRGTLGGTVAWSDYSADASFTTASTIVAAPSILAPANGAVNIAAQPTLTSSAFAVQNGVDAHHRSRWQISASADFSGALVWDSGDVVSLTQAVVPANTLVQNTTYFVRVRHIGQVLGPSGWSAPTSFQTKTTFTYVEPPAITAPSNGQTNVSLTPSFPLSAFNVIGGADTHDKSQWQVRLASGNWAAPVYDSGEIAAATSHSIPVGSALTVTQDFVVRARYKGQATGWSAWSNEVSFRTGVPSGSQQFTTPGTYNFTVPAGVTALLVHLHGPGGGGTLSNGNGGSGGGYSRKYITVTPGQVIPVVVGARGVKVSSGNVAGNGTTTSFGGYFSATGGLSGPGTINDGQSTLGPEGGIGVGGDVNYRGGRGGGWDGGGGGGAGPNGPGADGTASRSADNFRGSGGASGGSPAGRGGNPGEQGQSYGGGGGNFSDGADGAVIVTW